MSANPGDFLPVQVLRAHEWRPVVAECRCGWNKQDALFGGRRVTKLDHPEHVAEMLRQAGVLKDGSR